MSILISNIKLIITPYPPYQIMVGLRYGIDCRIDEDMAALFGLSLEEYELILINNGAITLGGQMIFRTEQECQRTIEQLEPYLIMAKLTSELNTI